MAGKASNLALASARALSAPRRTPGLRHATRGSRMRVFAVAEVETVEAAANTAPPALEPSPAPAPAAPSPAPAPAPASASASAQEAAAPVPAPPSPDALAAPANTVRVAFIVPNLRLDFGNHLRIAGGAPAMGEWSASAAPAMTWHEGDVWTAVLALPPGDHVFKLVIMDPSGATFWELGVNRRMHVPLACVPLSAMSTAPAVKCLCDFGNTDGTKLQPTELSGECLQASVTAAETALGELLYQKVQRQQDSQLEAAIAAQTAELERIKEAQRRAEAAVESRLVELLYQREAKTGTELAGQIMEQKARIERLLEARRTLDALTLEEGAWAQPAVQPPHGL